MSTSEFVCNVLEGFVIAAAFVAVVVSYLYLLNMVTAINDKLDAIIVAWNKQADKDSPKDNP